jgi:hypothetical protein
MLLIVMQATVGRANTIVGDPADWDTNPADGVGTWVRLGTAATVGEDTFTTPGDHFLTIDFSGAEADTVRGDAVTLFTGTWQTEYWIEFDFWASETPAALEVRWADNDGAGRVWHNTVSPGGAGSWNTLRTDSFSDYTNWKDAEGWSQENFLNDLDSIDWIGVYISHADADGGSYGVDDFQLMVPEPSEYAMLAAALMTAVFVMRRKRLNPIIVTEG